jgi:hypothetical protein
MALISNLRLNTASPIKEAISYQKDNLLRYMAHFWCPPFFSPLPFLTCSSLTTQLIRPYPNPPTTSIPVRPPQDTHSKRINKMLLPTVLLTPPTAAAPSSHHPRNDPRPCYRPPAPNSPPRRADDDRPCSTLTPSSCCPVGWDCYHGACTQNGNADKPTAGSCTDETGVCPGWCL